MLVTIAEAALLAKRGKSTIYQWIEHKRLKPVTGTDGIKRVDGREVLRVESETKRGRPRGTARSGHR